MLIVLKIDKVTTNGARFALFKCSFCGKKVLRRLSNKSHKSCGCSRYKHSHGMHSSRIYRTWSNMKGRCSNKNDTEWKNYGGRGIKVCEEWLKFQNFHEWAKKNGYCETLYIDRIDNDKGYTPENCRWVTSKISGSNKRCVRLTAQKAKEIREMRKSGVLQRIIAEKFKVSGSHISRICNGIKW